jgi:hypothetical protein
MHELLLLIACINAKGCSSTTSAYYLAHPKTVQILKQQGNSLKEWAGPEAVAVSSTLLFAARGAGVFRITNTLSLELSNKNNNLLVFRINF